MYIALEMFSIVCLSLNYSSDPFSSFSFFSYSLLFLSSPLPHQFRYTAIRWADKDKHLCQKWEMKDLAWNKSWSLSKVRWNPLRELN